MMQPASIVDLRSDTVTRPAPAMREAIYRAEVGDDVFGDDPAVNRLEMRVAELLGKEAALFVPSGTMANLLAVVTQTRPGDTILLHETAHVYRYESGGCAMVAGVLTRTLPGEHGLLAPDTICANLVQTDDPHRSCTTMALTENTMNAGGGAVYPLAAVEALGAVARQAGIIHHCDGARLWNAAVAEGVAPAAYAAHCDTVSVCLSKGLGCPVGSLLSGPHDTIVRARRFRKLLGGGMRQAGVLAAAGLYALDHHIERLAEDHRRAAAFREAIEGLPGVRCLLPAPTNMVFADVADAARWTGRLNELGVWCTAPGPARLRFVFHLDVDDAALDRAIEAVKQTAREADNREDGVA